MLLYMYCIHPNNVGESQPKPPEVPTDELDTLTPLEPYVHESSLTPEDLEELDAADAGLPNKRDEVPSKQKDSKSRLVPSTTSFNKK